MTPWWKIRRELLRLWRQLSFWPVYPFEQAWFRLYPRLYPSAYRFHAGNQPNSANVAVFLIFQPGGIQPTVLATCRHLAAAGYAVHIVSNAAITAADLERLKPHCAKITERPNLGYDFGGYKDAVLHLLQVAPNLDNLLLLNDSVWFPALKDCDLLNWMCQCGADVSGAVYSYHQAPYRCHLQSYMINFSSRAYCSTAFRTFWKTYRMSNNKVRTIKHGERRLTCVLRDAGLRIAGRYVAYAPLELSNLSEQDRAAIAAFNHRRTTRRPAQPLPGEARLPWTSEQADFPATYLLSNHPIINFRVLGFPILKKDRGEDFRRQRAALLAPGADDLRDMMEPDVLEAVSAWDSARKHRR